MIWAPPRWLAALLAWPPLAYLGRYAYRPRHLRQEPAMLSDALIPPAEAVDLLSPWPIRDDAPAPANHVTGEWSVLDTLFARDDLGPADDPTTPTPDGTPACGGYLGELPRRELEAAR